MTDYCSDPLNGDNKEKTPEQMKQEIDQKYQLANLPQGAQLKPLFLQAVEELKELKVEYEEMRGK